MIIALHMAVADEYFDCGQLLLDLHANISAVTFPYGTSMDLIGAGSTPLHYAACGGNLKCCQALLSRDASRLTLNCNGWLPLDVARMWGRHWLEPLLEPNSDSIIPRFPSSNYLSMPLLSILNIARECGIQSLAVSIDDNDTCAVCLERLCSVATADMASSLLLNYRVPLQKKLNYPYPSDSVRHACFTITTRNVNLRPVHRRFKRTGWLQIFSVQSPVVHFLQSLFHCAPVAMARARLLNREMQNHMATLLLDGPRQQIQTKLTQNWREQLAQTCCGAGKAAAENTNAIQKLISNCFRGCTCFKVLIADG